MFAEFNACVYSIVIKSIDSPAVAAMAAVSQVRLARALPEGCQATARARTNANDTACPCHLLGEPHVRLRPPCGPHPRHAGQRTHTKHIRNERRSAARRRRTDWNKTSNYYRTRERFLMHFLTQLRGAHDSHATRPSAVHMYYAFMSVQMHALQLYMTHLCMHG